MLFATDPSLALQFGANAFVNLHARAIVRGHNERILWRLRVLFRDGRNALLMSGYLVNPALLIEIVDSFPYIAPCKLLNHFPQLEVLLAHDLFSSDRLHAGIWKLGKRASSLACFVLSPISHEPRAIIRT